MTVKKHNLKKISYFHGKCQYEKKRFRFLLQWTTANRALWFEYRMHDGLIIIILPFCHLGQDT